MVPNRGIGESELAEKCAQGSPIRKLPRGLVRTWADSAKQCGIKEKKIFCWRNDSCQGPNWPSHSTEVAKASHRPKAANVGIPGGGPCLGQA
jgi:hypothetical protein